MGKINGEQAKKVVLSERHNKILLKERNRHTSSNQLCRRIDIILLSNNGQTNSSIARKLGTTRMTVINWRNRWVLASTKLETFEKGKDGQGVSDLELRRYLLGILKDIARSGTPKTITAAQEQQIVALACEEPIQHGVPITDWTHEMLAKTAIAKYIVSTISSSQVGRILKNMPTPTPEI